LRVLTTDDNFGEKMSGYYRRKGGERAESETVKEEPKRKEERRSHPPGSQGSRLSHGCLRMGGEGRRRGNRCGTFKEKVREAKGKST